MMAEDDAIVIDCGSGFCKAGFAGDDAPMTFFSSVVGTPRFPKSDQRSDSRIGNEAQTMREFLNLKYPIQRGVVTNFDDAEKLWDSCFKNLNAEPANHSVLISEPAFNPSGNRECMAEYMFEKFNVPAFILKRSAVLDFYSLGKLTGLVLNVGEGITQTMPVYDGHPIPHANHCQELGGRDVTLYLQRLLHERGYSFTTTAELESVREIKEKLCYTSLDFDDEMSKSTQETSFVLPDGNKITIGKEKLKCAECLFQPSLTGQDNDLKGLHVLLQSCIKNCDIEARKDLFRTVLLCGGGSCMLNLKERLNILWKAMVPADMVSKSDVIAPPDRRYSTWIGGSILASWNSFQNVYVTKKEYEEFGPPVVHRKCV